MIPLEGLGEKLLMAEITGRADDMVKRAILIAGPTASGKSKLALELADKHNGVIINADAMQVYRVLERLSARPGAAEMLRAEHFLYGFVDPAERFSAGAWLRAVRDLLGRGDLSDRTLIFVGGTGLYFKVLSDGISHVPRISAEVVASVSAEVLPLGRDERAQLLRERDPATARMLREPDRQRLIRALSVLAATGRSLSEWLQEGQSGVLNGFEIQKLVLNPDRDLLAERIEVRFSRMLEEGATKEVRALLALNLSPGLPAMKAIGVRQIADWQEGLVTREQATTSAVTATRQYAKRQRTWFRKAMKDWEWIKD